MSCTWFSRFSLEERIEIRVRELKKNYNKINETKNKDELNKA